MKVAKQFLVDDQQKPGCELYPLASTNGRILYLHFYASTAAAGQRHWLIGDNSPRQAPESSPSAMTGGAGLL
jgi:hypothetical protein